MKGVYHGGLKRPVKLGARAFRCGQSKGAGISQAQKAEMDGEVRTYELSGEAGATFSDRGCRWKWRREIEDLSSGALMPFGPFVETAIKAEITIGSRHESVREQYEDMLHWTLAGGEVTRTVMAIWLASNRVTCHPGRHGVDN